MEVAVATCITKDSLRPSKRLKLTNDGLCNNQENSRDEEPILNSCDEQTQDEALPEDKPKQKRNWESWGWNDINIFFDALCEYGKDFDKIYAYMKHKLRHETKNKDQIRHFYYRTWNKISKNLSFQPDKEKRATYDLYGLICYGELRKKGVKGFGKKQMKKVDDLINHGCTMIRFRGRNSKLKPPNCKALKKLQDAELPKEKASQNVPSKHKPMPRHLCIELIPACNGTWCAVQKSANNPRLRFSYVDSKMKLSYIIDALKKKFKGDFQIGDSTEIVLSPMNLNELNESLLYENTQNNDHEPDTPNQNLPNGTHEHSAMNVFTLNSKQQKVNSDSASTSSLHNDILLSPGIGDDSKQGNKIPCIPVVTTAKESPLGSAQYVLSSSPMQSVKVDTNHPVQLRTLKWTSDVSSNLTLTSLYLAMGKPDVIRLKYSFEKSKNCTLSSSQAEGQTKNSSNEIVKRFISLASMEYKQILTPSKRTKNTKKIVSPQTNPQPRTTYVPICPSTIANSPGTQPGIPIRSSPDIMLPPKDINLPALRKRGRNPTLKPVNIVRRKLIPKPLHMSGNNKTLVPGAVAVNIVPQPAQLVQFAQVPPVSAQLMNSGNAATGGGGVVSTTTSLQKGVVTSSPDILSKAVAQSLQGFQSGVQVLDQGFVNPNGPRDASNTIQLSQLINITDSNSSTTWSNMLSDMDLTSFLQNATTSQDTQTLVKQNSLNQPKKIDNQIPTVQVQSFSADIAPKSTMVTSTFVPSDESVGSFSQLALPREHFVASTGSTIAESQPKLSVLTTPVKDSLRTPTKIDTVTKENPVCSVRIPSPTFESNSWLTSEVADISLGGIISEINKEQKMALGNNVTTAIDCMLDENSVDFVNRFKDLAAKMAVNSDSSTCTVDTTKRTLTFKDTNDSSVLTSVGSNAYEQMLHGPGALSQTAKDIPMPIYHTEESTGPLDGLAFVLPTNDSGSSSDSVKGFSVGQ